MDRPRPALASSSPAPAAWTRSSVRPPAAPTATGYGALVSDPNGILALPEGFSYKLVARSGQTPTADGMHPSDPDGMGVFRGSNGGSVLVTNHENSGNEPFGVPAVEGSPTIPGAIGGTSTIVVDRAGNRIHQYTCLAGTDNNCAGGITPWGTWLTCEETERRAGQGTNTKDHGYVFEVDPQSREANIGKSPVPLKFMGRYSHEAVAVDPRDQHHLPHRRRRQPQRPVLPLDSAGRLPPGQGRAARTRPLPRRRHRRPAAGHELLSAAAPYRGPVRGDRGRHPLKVSWVDVPDRDARTVSVRKQFPRTRITRSRKLEGQWWADGGAFFVSSFARTVDGSVNQHDGQVWFYDPASETVTLKTIFGVNPDPELDTGNFDGPDNITVSAHGGLILAEDGDGISAPCRRHLPGQGLSPGPQRVQRQRVLRAGLQRRRKTLFVNIQSPGFTLAVTGPWGRPSNAGT